MDGWTPDSHPGHPMDGWTRHPGHPMDGWTRHPGHPMDGWTPDSHPGHPMDGWTPDSHPGHPMDGWTPDSHPGHPMDGWTPDSHPGHPMNGWTPDSHPGHPMDGWTPDSHPGHPMDGWTPDSHPGHPMDGWTPDSHPGDIPDNLPGHSSSYLCTPYIHAEVHCPEAPSYYSTCTCTCMLHGDMYNSPHGFNLPNFDLPRLQHQVTTHVQYLHLSQHVHVHVFIHASLCLPQHWWPSQQPLSPPPYSPLACRYSAACRHGVAHCNRQTIATRLGGVA